MFNILIFILLLKYCYGQKEVDTSLKHDQDLMPDGRIIGGDPVNITEYPYQASLEIYNRHACGAIVIGKAWAITAGHCVFKQKLESIRLRVGTSYKGKAGTIHEVESIKIHPRYYNYDFDIAVIKVSNEFEFRKSVAPITVTNQEPTPGVKVVVTGWGAVKEGGRPFLKLQKVQIKIIDRNKCSAQYSKISGKVSEQMICAGVRDGEKDSCNGDGGGPMTAYGQLVGIVSWGIGCADRRYPGVYTNVAKMKWWIVKETGVR